MQHKQPLRNIFRNTYMLAKCRLAWVQPNATALIYVFAARDLGDANQQLEIVKRMSNSRNTVSRYLRSDAMSRLFWIAALPVLLISTPSNVHAG